MLQLVYISTARNSPDLARILDVSRRNNLRDDITGLLYADGVRFLQALEGPSDKVDAAYSRIRDDDRHRAVVLLSRTFTDERQFGNWSMADRGPGKDGDAMVAQIEPLLRAASPNVRATFESFSRVDWAA